MGIHTEESDTFADMIIKKGVGLHREVRTGLTETFCECLRPILGQISKDRPHSHRGKRFAVFHWRFRCAWSVDDLFQLG